MAHVSNESPYGTCQRTYPGVVRGRSGLYWIVEGLDCPEHLRWHTLSPNEVPGNVKEGDEVVLAYVSTPSRGGWVAKYPEKDAMIRFDVVFMDGCRAEREGIDVQDVVRKIEEERKSVRDVEWRIRSITPYVPKG